MIVKHLVENVRIPASEISKAMTVDVEIVGYRGWLIRLTIAKWLIKLACRIAGMGLKING